MRSPALFDRHRKPPDELRDLAEPPVVMFRNGSRQTRQTFVVADRRDDPLVGGRRESGRPEKLLMGMTVTSLTIPGYRNKQESCHQRNVAVRG